MSTNVRSPDLYPPNEAAGPRADFLINADLFGIGKLKMASCSLQGFLDTLAVLTVSVLYVETEGY